MSTMMRFVILSAIFVAGLVVPGTYQSQDLDEARKDSLLMQSSKVDLRQELLTNYSRTIALPQMQPNTNVRNPIPVMLLYTFSKLVELNEKAEQLSVMAYAQVTWTDKRLQWNSSRNGVFEMVFDLGEIWFPNIIFANSVQKASRLLNKDQDVARVIYTGEIEWTGILLLTSPCEMDITNFPVDVQVCEQSFRIEPRTSDTPTLLGVNALSTIYDRYNVKFYQDSSWDINVTSGIVVTNPNPIGENTMKITLTVRRKYQYYLNRILAPVTLFSVLVLFVFLIPPDAGEKLSLGVTLLLTFSVFQMMIDEDLPASSTSTALLTTAMVLLQVCSAFSIAGSVLVLNMHHLDPDHGKLPPILRFIFFNILATLTCYCGKVKELKKSDMTSKVFGQEETADKTNTSNEALVLKEIRTLLRELPEKLKDETETSEWKMAAMIVDRLLMFVCLLTIASVYVHLMVNLQAALSEQMRPINDSHVAANRDTYNQLLNMTRL